MRRPCASLGLEPWVFAPDADRAPFEAGKQAMDALMNASPRPDAIIFANDNLAAGGLLAGQRAGLKIPEDCAVLGLRRLPVRRDAAAEPEHDQTAGAGDRRTGGHPRAGKPGGIAVATRCSG